MGKVFQFSEIAEKVCLYIFVMSLEGTKSFKRETESFE